MTIPRPFSVHYNPYTQTIEVIDGKEQIVNMVRTLRSKEKNSIKIFLIGLFFKMIWIWFLMLFEKQNLHKRQLIKFRIFFSFFFVQYFIISFFGDRLC
jgi:hypothetical protein